MPPGWFTEPVRAWREMQFTSDLCTPGHPLCILSAAAIYADRRLVSQERMTERAYRFRRVDGRIGAAERIWNQLREHGGVVTEGSAAAMADCTVPQLHQMVHAALTARVLVCRRSGAGNYFEMGPVSPTQERAR